MKSFAITLLMVLAKISLMAQPVSDYKVVFDLTSKDSLDQRSVIRWVNEITNEHPNAELEVVLYGQSVDLVVKGHSFYENSITQIISQKKATFKICAIALKNHQIREDQLMAGVLVVPDGIYEIISRQRQGWGYIKASR